MSNRILNFSGFSKIFEGGAAIKTSRRIREDEFPKTLDNIKEILFKYLNIIYFHFILNISFFL